MEAVNFRTCLNPEYKNNGGFFFAHVPLLATPPRRYLLIATTSFTSFVLLQREALVQ